MEKANKILTFHMSNKSKRKTLKTPRRKQKRYWVDWIEIRTNLRNFGYNVIQSTSITVQLNFCDLLTPINIANTAIV